MGDSLQEALLNANGGPHEDGLSQDGKDVGGHEKSTFWILSEVQEQLSLAVPMILVNSFDYALYIVSLSFVGHIGELELASAALATSAAGVTGFSLVIGLGCALETLCGQAFGAKQYRSVGIYLQRGIVVLNCVCVPVAILWLFLGKILRAIGQDPEVSDHAGRFAIWLIPALFAYATLQAIVKFLQTQSIVLPMLCLSLLGLVIHLPVCWFLITKSGLGYIGAAAANGVSSVLNVVFLLVYIYFSPKCQATWIPFSAEAFRDLKPFILLALPSALMVCLEFWSFESVVLMSGWLPNPQLEVASFSICLNTLGVMYMIPYGLSAAASTRVANELGAGRISAAKKAVAVAAGLGLGEGVIMCIVALSLRNVWAYVFTNEPAVVRVVSSFMPILAILAILDACQGVLSGITRGSGSQLLGALSNLVAYYLVGLPLGISLAFFGGLKDKGLWIGIVAALAVQTAALGAMAAFSSWKKQAEDAIHRSADGGLPTNAQSDS